VEHIQVSDKTAESGTKVKSKGICFRRDFPAGSPHIRPRLKQ
jgi:hypothetical protein